MSKQSRNTKKQIRKMVDQKILPGSVDGAPTARDLYEGQQVNRLVDSEQRRYEKINGKLFYTVLTEAT